MAGIHFLMRPISTCSNDKVSVGPQLECNSAQEKKTVSGRRDRDLNRNFRQTQSEGNVDIGIRSESTGREEERGGEESRCKNQRRESWDSLITLSRGDITCTLSPEVSFESLLGSFVLIFNFMIGLLILAY